MRRRHRDSQAAIPLATMTAGRVVNLYDLMDAAYDAREIHAISERLGHVPIIDIMGRRGVQHRAVIVDIRPAFLGRRDAMPVGADRAGKRDARRLGLRRRKLERGKQRQEQRRDEAAPREGRDGTAQAGRRDGRMRSSGESEKRAQQAAKQHRIPPRIVLNRSMPAVSVKPGRPATQIDGRARPGPAHRPPGRPQECRRLPAVDGAVFAGAGIDQSPNRTVGSAGKSLL